MQFSSLLVLFNELFTMIPTILIDNTFFTSVFELNLLRNNRYVGIMRVRKYVWCLLSLVHAQVNETNKLSRKK